PVSDAGAADLCCDVLNLRFGQLRDHRQRYDLTRRLQRFGEIRLRVVQVVVGAEIRQRNRIAHAGAAPLRLQERLQLLSAAVGHADDVEVVHGPDVVEFARGYEVQ